MDKPTGRSTRDLRASVLRLGSSRSSAALNSIEDYFNDFSGKERDAESGNECFDSSFFGIPGLKIGTWGTRYLCETDDLIKQEGRTRFECALLSCVRLQSGLHRLLRVFFFLFNAVAAEEVGKALRASRARH